MCEAATACGTGCPEGRLCPRGARGHSWELLAVTAGGGQGEPLAFHRQRPEMLLSTPTAHTAAPLPPNKQLSTVLRLRNPGLGDPGSCKEEQLFPVIKMSHFSCYYFKNSSSEV